uniref:Uncharacterized protein n=1 Tax=Physcomitrium patens TaxID=3218 RepID=A0A2K1JG12_PHYPA|nr:hypothetical protein PHYPA_017850 [Physcomitrium patens]
MPPKIVIPWPHFGGRGWTEVTFQDMHCSNATFINLSKAVWIFYELLGDCPLPFADEGIEAALATLSVETASDYDWVLISSASCHFANNPIMFST